MKYIVLAVTLCLMTLVPQENFAAVAVSKAKTPTYQEMDKAEKRAFRKDLRKKIKAAKKTPPKGNFDNYWVMGVSFALIGLVGVVLGSILNLWIIYSLGGLFLTAGLVLMILYWLDVI